MLVLCTLYWVQVYLKRRMLSRFTLRHIACICAALASLALLVFPLVAFGVDAPADGTNGSAGIVQAGLEVFSHGLSFILAHIAILGLQWGIFIMAIFGVLLDLSLLLTFNMGAILAKGTSVGDAIAQAWTIFRDLANLMFIAGMVWVSIAMILQVQVQVPGGSVGKFIANIIVAALLVNFSFFFTGVIIDASNNVSRLIYQEGVLNGESAQVQDISLSGMIAYVVDFQGTGDTQIFNTPDANRETASGEANVVKASLGFIGSQFVHQTNLSSIINPGVLRKQVSATDGNYTIILVALVGTALLTATIQLFASLFFLIIGRFIILIILLTLSPLIVFSIMGIAPFAEWGKHWWKSLMSQVVFLPVFVFLTAVSFRITNGFIATVGSGDVSIADIVGSPTGEEWNLALGLIVTYIIAWGLLKQAKTISENIAQGKQVQLPSVEMIQGGAAKVGSAVGGFGERTATLPRQALRAGGGGIIRGVGNIPPLRWTREGISEGVSDAVKGGRAYFDKSYAFRLDREKRAKEKALEDIQDTQRQITALESRRDAESDPVEREKLNQQISNAEDRLKSQAGSMHEVLGAKGMAKKIGGLDAKGQQAVLDSLEDEKAQGLYDELRKQGRLKAKGGGTDTNTGTRPAAGSAATTPAKGDSAGAGAVDTNAIVTELKGLRRDARIEAMREKKRDMAGVIATKEGRNKMKTEIGPGALGELPADLIINNNDVLNELDDADMAVVKGRNDITPEEYETIERQRETQQRRASAPQPADLARVREQRREVEDTIEIPENQAPENTNEQE